MRVRLGKLSDCAAKHYNGGAKVKWQVRTIGMRTEGERKGVVLKLLLGQRAFGVTPLKKVWGKDMWAETEWLIIGIWGEVCH